jgi:pimeloyl-ACP methyl ester carboxylesterase
LYSPESAARIPNLVKELLDTKSRRLVETALAARLLVGGERLAAGFFLSVSCTEDVPFLPKDLGPLFAGTFAGDYRLQQQIRACAIWPRGRVSGAHRQPTRSDIPTLLLSGEFDPVTPPSGGDEVARGLSRGVHVVLRNNGHPIGSADKCVASMMGQLMQSGSVVALDRSCAEKIPAPKFVPVERSVN